MPSPIIGRPVPDELWESIRAEFARPPWSKSGAGAPNSWKTRPR
jgi:hypothetical protein